MKHLSYYLDNPKALLIDVNKSKEELLKVELKSGNGCASTNFPYFVNINCDRVNCFKCPFYDEYTITEFISSIDVHRAPNGGLYEYRISKSGKKYRKYFK